MALCCSCLQGQNRGNDRRKREREARADHHTGHPRWYPSPLPHSSSGTSCLICYSSIHPLTPCLCCIICCRSRRAILSVNSFHFHPADLTSSSQNRCSQSSCCVDKDLDFVARECCPTHCRAVATTVCYERESDAVTEFYLFWGILASFLCCVKHHRIAAIGCSECRYSAWQMLVTQCVDGHHVQQLVWRGVEVQVV